MVILLIRGTMYLAICVFCFAINITESQVDLNYGARVLQSADSGYYFLPKNISEQHQKNLFVQPISYTNRKFIKDNQPGDNSFPVLYKYPPKQIAVINSNKAQNPQENRRYKVVYKKIYNVRSNDDLDINSERSANYTILLKYGHNDNERIPASNLVFGRENSNNVRTDTNNINEITNVDIHFQGLLTSKDNVTNSQNYLLAKGTAIKPERTERFNTIVNSRDLPDDNIKVTYQNVIDDHLNKTSTVANNDSMYGMYDFYNRQGLHIDNINIVDVPSSKYSYNGNTDLNNGNIPNEKFSNSETQRNSDYRAEKFEQLFEKNYTDTYSKYKEYFVKSDNNSSKNYFNNHKNVVQIDFEPNPVNVRDNEDILEEQNLNHPLNGSVEIQPDSNWYTYQVNVVPVTKPTHELTNDNDKTNIFSNTSKLAIGTSKNSLEISGNVVGSEEKDPIRVIDIRDRTEMLNTAYENHNVYPLKESIAFMNGTSKTIVDGTYLQELNDSGVNYFNSNEDSKNIFNSLNAKHEDPVKEISMAGNKKSNEQKIKTPDWFRNYFWTLCQDIKENLSECRSNISWISSLKPMSTANEQVLYIFKLLEEHLIMYFKSNSRECSQNNDDLFSVTELWCLKQLMLLIYKHNVSIQQN